MKFLDVILTANRNLTRSKLRTLLTILAIFVGAFTLTLTTALNTGAREYLERQLGNVSVPGVFHVVPKTDVNPFAGTGELKEYDPDKKQSTFRDILTSTMARSDVDKLQKVEGVEKAEPFYNVGAEYIRAEDSKKYQVPQLTQNIYLNLDLAAGRLLQDNGGSSAILPEHYLEPLGFNDAQDAVGKKAYLAYKNARQQVLEKEVTVVGVMRKSFVTEGQLFVSDDVVEEIAAAQGQSNRFFAVLVKIKNATDETDESVLKERLQSTGNYTALSVKERIGTVITVITAITAALNVVGVIALIAAAFGIINTLLMSVYERTHEIGLMKALGMRRGKVFALFAIEAVLVGFWGSLIAVGAAWGVSIFVNQFATQTFLKDFEGFVLLVVTPLGAAFVIGLIMVIAFLAGTLPAIKASRLNPIDALRSE
ncbi:MAG: ABC transporter permease [Candidatus Saccharimonadales bacterium]